MASSSHPSKTADTLIAAGSVFLNGFADSIVTNWNTYSQNLINTETSVAQNIVDGNVVGAYLTAQRGVIDVGVPAQRFGEQTVGTLAATWGLANAGVTAIEVGVNVLKTPVTLTPALVTVGGRTMAGVGAFAGEAEGIAGSLGTAGVGVMAMAGTGGSTSGPSTTFDDIKKMDPQARKKLKKADWKRVI